MINIRTLKKIEENGGLTLKRGRPIVYKTGYQVATEGVEVGSMVEAMKAIKEYGGDCGIWLHEGIWYIDKSRRISTKKEAVSLGRQCGQLSILNWRNMELVFC